jgi:hypothetical protein
LRGIEGDEGKLRGVKRDAWENSMCHSVSSSSLCSFEGDEGKLRGVEGKLRGVERDAWENSM